MEYYERKRQAIEATIAEIHKAQSAYKKQTEEINYTAKGLANLEFKIKNELDTNLQKIRQQFIDDVKNPVAEQLALYQQEKANKKAKMTKEDKILQALEFQNAVTKMQAQINIAGDGINLLQELDQIEDEDLYTVFQGMLIANTSDQNKSKIRSKHYVDQTLALLEEQVQDLKMVEADMSPMFGVNYGGAGFDEVVAKEVFGKDLSDTFFQSNDVVGD